MEKKHPVIVSARMANNGVLHELQKSFLVKVSPESPADLIFPTFSSVSFLLFGFSPATTYPLHVLEDRVEALGAGMKHSYVLALLGEPTRAAMANVFSCMRLRPGLLVCASVPEAVKIISELVKAYAKVELDRAQVAAEQSAQELYKHASSPDLAALALSKIPELSLHECAMLLDALGSVSAVASASVQDLLSFTPLSTEQAQRVCEFFRVDRVEE